MRRNTERRRADRSATAHKRRQRDVLCDVMLSASQCETWLTLDELTKLTHYPQASISAQLRHLRKPRFGGFELEKRTRASGRLLRSEDYGPVWEYRLRRGVRRTRVQWPKLQQGRRRMRRQATGCEPASSPKDLNRSDVAGE